MTSYFAALSALARERHSVKLMSSSARIAWRSAAADAAHEALSLAEAMVWPPSEGAREWLAATSSVVDAAAEFDLVRARALVDRVRARLSSSAFDDVLLRLLVEARYFDDALALALVAEDFRARVGALLNIAGAATAHGDVRVAAKSFDLAIASTSQLTGRARGWALRDVARALPAGDSRLASVVADAVRVAAGERSMMAQLAPYLAKAGDLRGAHAALRRFKGSIELHLAIARATAARSRSESGETHRAIEHALREARAMAAPRWSLLAQVSIATTSAELGNEPGARSILQFASQLAETATESLETRAAMFEDLLAEARLMTSERAAFALAWSWLERHAELVALLRRQSEEDGVDRTATLVTAQARAAIAHADLGHPGPARRLLVEALSAVPPGVSLEPHFQLWLALEKWPRRAA